MEITQDNQVTKGKFRLVDDDAILGEMTYSWAGNDKFIIDHTHIEPEQHGKGLGKLLVLEAVKYARENDLKIIPPCPFAKSVFMKDAELRDVVFGSLG